MDNHVGSFTLDEGVDNFGTRTQLIFDGDQIVKKRSYDANPLLEEAHAARVATAGNRWGEGIGTRVGTVPMAVYADAMLIQGKEERSKFLQNWLRANPKFVTFEKFLK